LKIKGRFRGEKIQQIVGTAEHADSRRLTALDTEHPAPLHRPHRDDQKPSLLLRQGFYQKALARGIQRAYLADMVQKLRQPLSHIRAAVERQPEPPHILCIKGHQYRPTAEHFDRHKATPFSTHHKGYPPYVQVKKAGWQDLPFLSYAGESEK